MTQPTVGPITVLSGGVGAARFLRGVLGSYEAADITAIVNVGDDAEMHGLSVSPDLDTITYTLAGAVNAETGWGLEGETWQAMGQLRRYAEANLIDPDAATGNDAAGWFSLGDLDLGTHLYRTSRLRAGATLTEVTDEIARTWGLELAMLPVTDDRLQTIVTTVDGRELSFQEYFVRENHQVVVSDIRFDGAATARPGPHVLESIDSARVVCIAPSNPVVSIDPVLAVPGVREAVATARDRTVVVSPIVGGAALKGPADRLLRELGHEATVVGIARWYAPLAETLVIDSVDVDLAGAVEAEGMACVVTDTIMSDPAVSAQLARTCIDAAIGASS
ncbi:MAG: 2-phospho-L-lactate transferase, partial [Acidimicrobiales bacterium]